MRMRKKKWVDSFIENEKEYLIDEFRIDSGKIILEIGMGMGDFITESSFNNPNNFYIGLEKDETCVARAIKKAQDKNLNNFRVMLKDASKINELFNPKSIDTIYLHFSDPWPKKHHHKRRLTYPTFLKLYEEILKDNGKLIVKTDNHDFFLDSLEYFKESNFKQIKVDYDYHSELYNEPMTGYQKRFTALNQPIYYAQYSL